MKKKTWKHFAAAALAFLVAAGVTSPVGGNIPVFPDTSITAYADETETLLTTITATGKEQASYSTANVATVSFSYTAEGSSAYHALFGWWGYGWSATVSPAEGYTITKCVFYDDKDRTATDSEAPFVVETTEEDKTPRINGTPILANTSKGIKKIEVYGYSSTSAATYSVTVTPGSNMTKTTDSGEASQTDLTGAMADVVYTADEGYYFPESYSVAEVNGITVTRNSYTQITVSGTPTADAPITLTAPTAKTTPAAPTTAAAVDCTTTANNDGKLTGVTTAMEYKKSDAASWTAGTGSDITGLVPGTYYVRVKATDTTNASGNQTLTIKGFISYTVTFKVVNGKWNDETTADKTATLTGHDGDTLNLTAEQIPSVGTKPDDNYKAGSWDTEPNTTAAITAATTYTYTYVQHEHIFEYNANGATITANCTAADCDLTSSPFLTIVAPQPTAGDTSLKYDGTVKAATLDGVNSFNTATGLNVSADDIIYSGTLSDGTAYTASSTAPSNAGDYTASVTVERATASVSYSIAKAEPTVTAPTGLTATYGQTLANVTLPTSADGTWTWADDTQSVGNAGSNNFIATYTPNDTINYNTKDNVQVTVTVNQAEPTVTAPTAISGLEYTSFAQALVTAGSTSDGTILYSKDGTNYNADVPTGINAGSYTVYWKVQGDANHLDKSPVSISGITIASIDPTVGAPTAIEGLVYDGTAHALVTAGTTDGGTLMYKLDDGDYSTDIPTATDARDYTVYYYVEGDDNYDTTQPVQLNVSIARATQNAPVLAYTDETVAGLCDGTITGLTTEMEMSTTGAENDYAPVTTDTLTGLAPGTYYIRYAEKANYLPSDPTVITINAGRMITITFVTYGGTRIEPITGAYNTPVEAPADPVKKGYTFTGWDQAIPAVIPAEDMTIAAQWRINSYTISFDTRGGTDVPSITQDYGSPITPPADPTKPGYVFDKWSKDIPATMPAENLVITASWKPSNDDPRPIPSNEQSDIPTKDDINGNTPSSNPSYQPDNAYYTPSTPPAYVQPASGGTPAIVTYPTDSSSSPIYGKNIYAKYDGKRSITLRWDAIDDVKSYTVYLITDGKAKKLTDTDGTEYTYKNVEPGKTYRFRVKYPTADGLSKASESFNITVAADAKKPVVTATAKNGKIILKWNKVPGAPEYAVYRVNSKGKLTKAGSTKKTQMVISQRPTDKGYAVKALVNGKWTTVTKADIAVVSE